MNANEMSFGIEIETTIPAGRLQVGSHGRGLSVAELPGWKADRDPSISAVAGREACEFVSPVYRGAEGLQKLLTDVKVIKSMGAEVNASCGLHVHVGFDKSDQAANAKLATLVANFEKAIYASTGTKSRENGRWCNSLQRYGAAETALESARYHRYHVANFASRHPTIEFRPFAASLNTTKIAGYACMCLAIVERSMSVKRLPKWTAKPTSETSPIHRGGEGQTALCRFFYTMGWTRGRVNHVYGNVAGPQSMPEVKKELMRLARKYDGQGE